MIRKLTAKIFGKSVALVDFDGEVTMRRAYKIGETWFVDRVGFGINTLILRDDGALSDGNNYCVRWFTP